MCTKINNKEDITHRKRTVESTAVAIKSIIVIESVLISAIRLMIVAGDWEVDTVIGRKGGRVLVTLVERKSKISLMALPINKKPMR